MPKSLLLAATLLAATSLAPLAPAFAATPTATENANANSDEAHSAQHLVDDATGTVGQIKADSHFDTLLKQAKGVFIMPNLVKGAFIVGGEGAQGVLLKHESDGAWSDPAFLTIGSISIGAEAGGKAGPAAMLLMTDKALNDFTQANNFSLGANAGLTIIGYSAAGQAPVGKGDIVLWSDQSGAFAGDSLSGGDITQNSAEDAAYYGKQVDAMQILSGKTHKMAADKLKSALPT